MKPVSTARKTTHAIIIVPISYARKGKFNPDAPPRSPEAQLGEAIGLAEAIPSVAVAAASHFNLKTPHPATLLGQGKIAELQKQIGAHKARLLIIDHALTPIQQRNLEKKLKLKVLDRTALILEIFGARARTREGALQVELAHLNYQKSRLVRSWTHLERQRGGFGFLGGPGETQIEADRRLLQQRIKRLETDLKMVRKRRALQRHKRKKSHIPVIALVGYTNAGKSTLFNRLTQANVMAQDLLFATLDPTLRKTTLPLGKIVIFSDTVGFISKLPHDLVAAFRATLEEVLEADLILHIHDCTSSTANANAQDVMSILREIGIDQSKQEHIIDVWNKSDALEEEAQLRTLSQQSEEGDAPLYVSALTGEGINDLLTAIQTHLARDSSIVSLCVPKEQSENLFWLYKHAEILEHNETACKNSFHLKIRFPADVRSEFFQKFGKFVYTAKPEP